MTFTAKVKPVAATGTVTFKDGAAISFRQTVADTVQLVRMIKNANAAGIAPFNDIDPNHIEYLGGSLHIRPLEGGGTEFELSLPLTLAIIDGFLTKIGDENYIFPLSLVEECVELTHGEALNRGNRRLINVRDSIVPYVRLREQFAMTGEAPLIEQIVIVRIENKRIGFAVDNVVGGHQTVIKNLGAFYREVEGISGATILGDGTVALILDVIKLVHIAEQEEVEIASARG